MKRFYTLLMAFAALVLSVSATATQITQKDKTRAAKLVSQMTLDEKIGLISGKTDGFHTFAVPRLGIPSVQMADGPQGVRNVSPLYAFGYGLTYTTFDYSDIQAVPAGDGYDITFKVTNTGKADAKEVAQVYVAPENPSIIRPAKELKGYDKKLIAKGAAAEYTVHLGPDAFSYYDVDSHSWKVDRGEYRILVGAFADDIRLEVKVKI